MCAVKLINKRKVQSSVLSNELSILQVIKDRVCSPDLVQIWDIYEDPYLVYIVMEYLGGAASSRTEPSQVGSRRRDER